MASPPMAIRFHCPNGHALAVEDNLAGKRGGCPKCGAVVRVPDASTASKNNAGKAAPLQGGPVDHPAQGVAAEGRQAEGDISKPAQGPVDATPPVKQPGAKPAAQQTDQQPTQPIARPTAKAVAKAKPVAQPVVQPPTAGPADAAWHLRTAGGQQYGPASSEDFRRWIAERRVTADAFVWREGWPDWRRAADAAGELPAPLAAARPPIPPSAALAPAPVGVAGSPLSVGNDRGTPSAATRYAQKRRHARRMRLLAATVLLVLTVTLAAVLAVIMLNPPATEEDDPLAGGRADNPPAAQEPPEAEPDPQPDDGGDDAANAGQDQGGPMQAMRDEMP
ncbi:MAG: DUF4339 domain-containing protein [Planctomycetota bacterium]